MIQKQSSALKISLFRIYQNHLLGES